MKQNSFPSIFDYSNPQIFLSEMMTAHQKIDPSFSIRRWAKEMGVSHTLLAMFLQGKRDIKLKHVEYLTRSITLTTSEKLYLQALIEFNSAETAEQKVLLQTWLSELHPGGNKRAIEFSAFRVISDWIHFAILALCSHPFGKPNSTQIEDNFKHKVDPRSVQNAINRLIELNLLKKDTDGTFHTLPEGLSSINDENNLGVQEYHRQVSDLAKMALVEQDPLEREFQGIALLVPHQKRALAKQLIRRFRDQFCKSMKLEEDQPSEAYQLNLQFFRLSNIDPKKDN
jgi:uncharacterized protein (TIGR02147 family)